jgi:hypothetical protein
LCSIIITDISNGVDGVTAPTVCVKRGVFGMELASKLLILNWKHTLMCSDVTIGEDGIAVRMVEKVARCHGGMAYVDARGSTHASVWSVSSFAEKAKGATSPRKNALSWMLKGREWPDLQR